MADFALLIIGGGWGGYSAAAGFAAYVRDVLQAIGPDSAID